ncbi:hypothetical protein E0H58_32310 [Kribbella speibonae]|uniref:Uncharacterized protein n=1 Tax=Kribbella speibonae TaxID=1572660 RepID=A0ABY1ZXF2_9ACTN|nr:hypothetical protein E0H58_32310 [Kribbella speibonae]
MHRTWYEPDAADRAAADPRRRGTPEDLAGRAPPGARPGTAGPPDAEDGPRRASALIYSWW